MLLILTTLIHKIDGGQTVTFGELMPQWRFVEEGWGRLTED